MVKQNIHTKHFFADNEGKCLDEISDINFIFASHNPRMHRFDSFRGERLCKEEHVLHLFDPALRVVVKESNFFSNTILGRFHNTTTNISHLHLMYIDNDQSIFTKFLAPHP